MEDFEYHLNRMLMYIRTKKAQEDITGQTTQVSLVDFEKLAFFYLKHKLRPVNQDPKASD